MFINLSRAQPLPSAFGFLIQIIMDKVFFEIKNEDGELREKIILAILGNPNTISLEYFDSHYVCNVIELAKQIEIYIHKGYIWDSESQEESKKA